MALTDSQKRRQENHIRYWKRREDEQLKHNIRDEAEYDRELKKIYQNMLDNCQKEIDAFYGKYAKSENITIAEAKKRVSKLDIERYERKAKRYVKERNFSKEANEEMRLYNATMKINRLELLKANIGLELVAGYDEVEKYMGGILKGRTEAELRRQAGILGKSVQNNSKLANSIVNASFHNANFSNRLWQYHDLMKNDMAKMLQTGLIQGKNPRVLAKEMRKYFIGEPELKNGKNGAVYNTERLMRTELARVQTEAQRQAFIENGFTQYTFIVNGGCCDICEAIAKKNDGHYDVDKMQPGLNAPPIHPHCRCSTAAYEDSDEYEAWLEHLENGGTTEQWNSLQNSGNSRIIEPEDKGDLFTSLDDMSEDLAERSLQVNNYLNTLGLPESKWSGRTLTKTAEEMGTSIGKKKRSCDIWFREDAPVKSIIHEHLHARSISRTPHLYGKYHRIEEATVEMLAESICKKNGIAYEPTYKKQTNTLRRVADMLGYDHYDFSSKLLSQSVDNREAWLKAELKQYEKAHGKSRQKRKAFEVEICYLFEGEAR